VKAAAALLVALVLAGCGAGERGRGTATLWVTRDRGAHVVFAGSVPAGDNGIRAVTRKLKVTTRYGGRYLQSVEGLQGSLTGQRDWFYFVNGVEGGVSAADVTLHAGDVLWWDYRRWTPATMHVPFVAGAYPQPFLHARTSVVTVAKWRPVAARLARQVHGVVNARKPVRDYILVTPSFAPDHVRIYPFRRGVVLELGHGIAQRLAADPTALRYRYGT
jgi:Domain of unknown function (DUF4430)